MTLPRRSNQDRAIWRKKCREQLSEHIKSKLGIEVNPADVRLITRAQDSYSWKFMPGRSHLFEKNISSHSIGAYVELCQEVGLSFEAIAKENFHSAKPAENFTNRIEELEAENSRLICEMEKWIDTAATELTLRKVAEESVNQLKMILHTVGLENQDLKAEMQKLVNSAENLKEKTKDSYQIVDEAFLVLEKLRSTLPSFQNAVT